MVYQPKQMNYFCKIKFEHNRPWEDRERNQKRIHFCPSNENFLLSANQYGS